MIKIILSILLIFFGVISAQKEFDIDSLQLQNPLDEVLITGQIGIQTISQSVNNLILITSNDIKETGSNDLAELFSNQALFDLNVDPALGTSVSIQGMQGNNINIMID